MQISSGNIVDTASPIKESSCSLRYFFKFHTESLMKNLITHFVAFLLGVALTAGLIMKTSNLAQLNSQNENTPQQPQDELQSFNSGTKLSNTKGADKDILIQQQAQEIERLTRRIHAVSEELNASLFANNHQSKPAKSPEGESEAQLRTMNMQTFEESMKTQFTDQFKSVVLQLEGERLEDIKQSYNNSSEKNEWSNQYENSIANFLATHDENGDHYLQSLNCNTNVCRLEVNTNDSDNWNSLYAKMTNESWYQSITVQEKSEYPGNVIYYLPSLNN